MNYIRTNFEHADFKRGNKAISKEWSILLSYTFKANLLRILNRPEDICVDY